MPVFRKFSPTELEGFLRLVDAELNQLCTIVVIGGAAVALGHHGTHATADLDLWSAAEQAFWDAVRRATEKAKEPVPPVQRATIAQPPYHFEERLRQLTLDGLKRLQILVPEAHDLALLKTARAEAHDLDAIEDIHRDQPLRLETLVERYHEAIPQVIGPLSRYRLNFLAVVARLFGEEVADQVGESLEGRRKRRQ